MGALDGDGVNLWVGLPAWIMSALFVSAAAYVFFQPLRAHSAALDAVTYTFAWIFTTTLYVLLSGLAGWLRPLPLGMVALGGLLLLAAVPASRRVLSGMREDIGRTRSALNRWWNDLPVWLRWLTALLGALSLIRFAVLILVLPPFVWDSLTYHLTNVAHWIQTGRIAVFDTPVIRIYTPANFETLATWFAVFLHHDLVIEAAGLPAYALAILALYALGRELGLSRTPAWLASLTYAFTPALLLATTGTKNDPHMAAYFLTCLAIIAGLLNRVREEEAANPLGQLLLLGVVVLFAFGTKAYMLHLSLALVAFGVLGAWRQRSWSVWANRLVAARSALKKRDMSGRMLLLGIAIAGLFMGGYWNVRNWVITGNPFYPYGVEIQGANVLPEGDRTARLNLSRLEGNLQLLTEKFGDAQQPISPDLPNTTGWGWFAYGIGLPALLWGLLRRPRVRWLAVTFGLALVFIFLSDRPSPWNMRYVIWFPALFSLAFGEWAETFADVGGRIIQGAMVLMTLSVGLNLVMMINYGAIRPGQFQQMLERSVWDRQSATLKVNMPAEYENAAVYVPKDALLGYNVSSNGFIYPLYRADFSQHIVYVPFGPNDSCARIVQEMSSRGTRYLFVAPEHTADGNIALLRRCSETPGSGLRQRARGLYVIKDG
jgi:hypothetical protein